MEDLLWRRKSTERFKYLSLGFIRLAEVLMSSLIPSIIGLIMVFITPKARVMQTMETISMLAFCVANCFFWTKYVKHRPKRVEFYVMNGIVFLIYAGLSVLAFLSADAYLYSILFSNMRGLELFGVTTTYSLINAHILLLLLMVITETVAHFVFKHKAIVAAENGAEKAEIKSEKVIPEQNNEKVKFLTVDEVNLELEREIEEATELILHQTEDVSEKNWDSAMVQGEDGEIMENIPDDPENDIDDSDYVSEAYAREEMSVTQNYDVDSLWNSDIYEGREKASEYDEEVYMPEMFITDEDDSLWDKEMYRGRHATVEYDYTPEEETEWQFVDYDDEEPLFNIDYDDESEEYMANSFEDYDSDSLWGDFTQG